MPKTAKRLEVFSESVIRGTTRMAQRHGAINLAQGFPDGSPPEVLLEALEKATRGPHHQYAMTWGAPRFREALARKIEHFAGVEVDADRHLVVTCGSTEAMMVAMMTVCDPGDRVIVFSPFYENYAADAILSGAEPIYVPLRPPGFGFEKDELEAAFRCGVKAIIVCNPSNPSGKVFRREELEFILALAEEYDAYVITDEPYEHLVYEPHRHVHACALAGGAERVIVCNSLSKTYSITGWRLGYVHASEEVIAQARKVHDFLTVGAAAPLQEAAVAGLELPDSYYRGLVAEYQKRRDLFLGYVRQMGLPFTEPEGAYFTLVDISPLGLGDDVKASEWFIREVGVAGVAGSSFFREPVKHLLRFHFAKSEEVLRQAGERLARVARG